MSMDEQPLLSICIPTYNRGEIVYEGVLHALGFLSEEIEVVVLDNHSPDSTEELLSAIADPRFHYYKNDENIGAANLLAVMRKASGKYTLLISDEDDIEYEGIEKLLLLLKGKQEFSLVYGSVLMYGEPYRTYQESIIHKKGYEAVKAIYMEAYMSGIVYNREILLDIIRKVPDKEIDLKFGGYNFAVVATYMCGIKDVYTMQYVLCDHVREGKRDTKSYFLLDKDTYCSSTDGRISVGEYSIQAFCSLNMKYEKKWLLLMSSVFECWIPAGTVSYFDTAFKMEKELKESLGMEENEILFPDKNSFNYLTSSLKIFLALTKKFREVTHTGKMKMFLFVFSHPLKSIYYIILWLYFWKECNALLKQEKKKIKISLEEK